MEQGVGVTEIASKYGVTRQAVYQRLKEDEKRKNSKNTSGYGLDLVRGRGQGEHRVVDPETGLVVEYRGKNAEIIGRMGDEKVSAFVAYNMELLSFRQGVDKSDVNDLYQHFARYAEYCRDHGVIPGNAACYLACGVSRQEISAWKNGRGGTPEHKKFAEDVTSWLASCNEQAGSEGMINAILSIYRSKAYDSLSDQPKVEVEITNPLGEKRSAEEIAKRYAEVLPDD